MAGMRWLVRLRRRENLNGICLGAKRESNFAFFPPFRPLLTLQPPPPPPQILKQTLKSSSNGPYQDVGGQMFIFISPALVAVVAVDLLANRPQIYRRQGPP
ncbi:hypothetical protein BJ912DRAFT_924194 [Pholiota molesta]|nr:hypothetical protein BJ912DRAFT_924194 [Pholiota molesta]